MQNYQDDQVKRARKIIAYRNEHEELFTGPKTVELMGVLEAQIARMLELSGEQDSSEGQSKVGTRSVAALVDAVEKDLQAISSTARTIRKHGGTLDFDFAMPHSRGDDDIIPAGEAFFEQASKPKAKALFLEWEMPPDFLTDLRADLDAYEGRLGNRNDHTQERKDDVKLLEAATKTLIHAIDGLDTLLSNKLRNNPDTTLYASWKQASRLERTRVHPKKKPGA